MTSRARQELRQAGWAGQPELIRFQPDSLEELDGGWGRALAQELGLWGPEWGLDLTVMEVALPEEFPGVDLGP